MRTPIIYTPEVLKAWEVSAGLADGRWVAARPYGHNMCSFWLRLRTAWRVFTGRYDALRWEGQEQ